MIAKKNEREKRERERERERERAQGNRTLNGVERKRRKESEGV